MIISNYTARNGTIYTDVFITLSKLIVSNSSTIELNLKSKQLEQSLKAATVQAQFLVFKDQQAFDDDFDAIEELKLLNPYYNPEHKHSNKFVSILQFKVDSELEMEEAKLIAFERLKEHLNTA
ncbi:hypothetical protein CTT31_20860 [Pseudoalteromonas maricaloris]|uniref:hypothetical protein n=1 Tax=Pseudoalteromonas maricaloris TaxID=184924 RepID=UPI0021AE2CAB|nr:hypothetical protein [Pseudoalteromonas flavipulchra]USE71537.1 hypothetical protein CTT31_20860 [Pseudoalteromonas flavipulchra]